MLRFVSGLTLLAASLGAQSGDLWWFEYAQAQAGTPHVYQFQNGVLMGGVYLGVNLAEVDATRARELKLKETYGVEITRVEEGSPADKAGIKANDVVLEYNGQRVEGMEQFGRLVRETPTGREVKLLISRNGATQTIAATVATRKASTLGPNAKEYFRSFDMPEFHMPDIPQIFTTYRSAVLGIEAESLGSQLAGYFGVKEGVLVRSVIKDSAAEKAGIKAGDVITKVDGSKVTTPNELSSAVRSASSKKPFSMELTRDHKDMTVNVTVESGRSEWESTPRTRVIRNVRM